MTLRFTEPNELADFMGLSPFEDSELAAAAFLLELAESMVTEHLEQDLEARFADDRLIHTAGGEVLLLPELPVAAVTAVEERAAGADAFTVLTVLTDYTVEVGHNGRKGILRRRGTHWPLDGDVEVNYDHGYKTTAQAADAAFDVWPYELPGAIRAVMLQSAARGMSNPTQLRQEQAGRWGGTYAEVGLYLAHTDKVALEHFRKGAG